MMAGLIVLLAGSAFGYVPIAGDTPANTWIKNTVSVAYTNRGGGQQVRTTAISNRTTHNRGVQVTTNVMQYIANPMSAGEVRQFPFVVYNAGNTNARLAVTNLWWTHLTGAGNWTNQLIWDQNRNGTYDIGTDRVFDGTNSMQVAEDATNAVLFRVVAKSSAVDGNTLTNFLFVTNKWGAGVYQAYTGYNPRYGFGAQTYGGPQVWRHKASVVITGPDIRVVKWVSVSNTGTYRAVPGVNGNVDVVPGTMLVYAISFTNKGSGEAKRLRFADLIPTNCVYVTNSMRYGVWNGSYVGATQLKDGVADDAPAAIGQAEGVYNNGARRVTFDYFHQNLPPDTAVYASGGAFYRGKVYFAVVVR
jgi:uncharacterized repeat protein (TIGR01451 family)